MHVDDRASAPRTHTHVRTHTHACSYLLMKALPTVYHVIAPTQVSRAGGDSFRVLAGRPHPETYAKNKNW
jgi:hypothetical protein